MGETSSLLNPTAAESRTGVANSGMTGPMLAERFGSISREVMYVPARLLLSALWLYQRTVSPVLPVVFGPACGCRFAPTCSHYAVEAVRVHGAVRGTVLALWRLLKCTPLHSGGFDPVPTPPSKFSCVALGKTIPVHSR